MIGIIVVLLFVIACFSFGLFDEINENEKE